MSRIEAEKVDSTRLLEAAQQPLEDLEERLADLERFIGNCQVTYLAAGSRERRQINQALFEKLFVSRDGVVAASPAGLIRGLLRLPEVASDSTSPAVEVLTLQEARRCRRERQNPDPVVRAGRGSNVANVVLHQGQHSNPELLADGSNYNYVVIREGFEPPTPALGRRRSIQLSYRTNCKRRLT